MNSFKSALHIFLFSVYCFLPLLWRIKIFINRLYNVGALLNVPAEFTCCKHVITNDGNYVGEIERKLLLSAVGVTRSHAMAAYTIIMLTRSYNFSKLKAAQTSSIRKVLKD